MGVSKCSGHVAANPLQGITKCIMTLLNHNHCVYLMWSLSLSFPAGHKRGLWLHSSLLYHQHIFPAWLMWLGAWILMEGVNYPERVLGDKQQNQVLLLLKPYKELQLNLLSADWYTWSCSINLVIVGIRSPLLGEHRYLSILMYCFIPISHVGETIYLWSSQRVLGKEVRCYGIR